MPTRDRIDGEKRDNLERAITAYERGAGVYTLERFPQQYAMTQNNLGNAYRDRLDGEKRDNLERAIACLRARRCGSTP